MKLYSVLIVAVVVVVALAATTNASFFKKKPKQPEPKLPESQSDPVVSNTAKTKLPETPSLPAQLPEAPRVTAALLSGRTYFTTFDNFRAFYMNGDPGQPVVRVMRAVPKANDYFFRPPEKGGSKPVELTSTIRGQAEKVFKDVVKAEKGGRDLDASDNPWQLHSRSAEEVLKSLEVTSTSLGSAMSAWLAILQAGVVEEKKKHPPTETTTKHIAFLFGLMRLFLEAFLPLYDGPVVPKEFSGKLLMTKALKGEGKYPPTRAYQEAKLDAYIANFFAPYTKESDAVWYFEWLLFAMTNDEQLRDLHVFPIPVPEKPGATLTEFFYSELWHAWADANLSPTAPLVNAQKRVALVTRALKQGLAGKTM